MRVLFLLLFFSWPIVMARHVLTDYGDITLFCNHLNSDSISCRYQIFPKIKLFGLIPDAVTRGEYDAIVSVDYDEIDTKNSGGERIVEHKIIVTTVNEEKMIFADFLHFGGYEAKDIAIKLDEFIHSDQKDFILIEGEQEPFLLAVVLPFVFFGVFVMLGVFGLYLFANFKKISFDKSRNQVCIYFFSFREQYYVYESINNIKEVKIGHTRVKSDFYFSAKIIFQSGEEYLIQDSMRTIFTSSGKKSRRKAESQVKQIQEFLSSTR
ncbi:MAG: hypothetical protein Q3M24_22300 [Candidatus Electrothrix aestuarii]|uniref:Uncharacterized protein n=1 Tax=Candidatus Electrothrix aestuarii TaxID=3062594 RepID=A0AAU8LVS8_9BACT